MRNVALGIILNSFEIYQQADLYNICCYILYLWRMKLKVLDLGNFMDDMAYTPFGMPERLSEEDYRNTVWNKIE